MAQKTFRGDAVAIAQVTDFTFGGTWEATDEIHVEINGKTVTVSAGATAIADVIDAVAAAFNDLDATIYPEFSGEIAASRAGTTELRFTALTPGVPFTVAVTTTEAGGGAADAQTIGSATATQPSRGPNHYDDPDNWDAAGVPADGDDLDFSRSTVPCLYGLDQAAITPASVEIHASYAGQIGLNDRNDAGYYEYRPRALTFSSVTNGVKIGHGPGPGSSRIRLKVGHGANATTFDVAGSGQPEAEAVKAVRLETGAAANVVNVTRGSVEIAGQPGEAATVATLRVGYQSNQASDADVFCGPGAAIATVVKSGGRLETQSNLTTVTQTEGDAGELVHQAGTLTTLHGRGGRVVYNSTGALATANLTGDCHLDFSQDLRPKTVTNPIEIGDARVRVSDPHWVVNSGGSLVLDFNQQPVEVNGMRLGTNVRLTRAATA